MQALNRMGTALLYVVVYNSCNTGQEYTDVKDNGVAISPNHMIYFVMTW